MSDKTFCDKCPREITHTEQYKLNIYKVLSDRTIIEIDLCPSCYAKLRRKADI